ncbi:hypothetical protein [Pseudomonas vanderleydeniana]|uniref:Lipoprotein n=1 Tax=Pseudomonas vanderleydeniana TaxID=2745495 RepID=A0A9E6PQP6_9PSED|nr:hypothetical protein [Pseudomonas vanderleydeniana]QXI31312.1 hypothetical protein HU752_015850 [Pseudomonas vanderleydeniana]
MQPLKTLLAISAVLIAGCASQPPVPPPQYPGLEKSDKIAIQDLRPHSESEKEIFSLLITSDAYAIYRVADTATKPTGPRLLAHRAYETLPELNNQPSIKVLHFVAYSNLQSQLRKNSLLAGFTGPIGVALLADKTFPSADVLTTQIDSQSLDKTEGKEEYTRAYFTAEENPKKSPVNLIYIDTEMLGKRVTTRCLVPPIASKPYLYLVEAYDMCISNHLALYQAKTPSKNTAAN